MFQQCLLTAVVRGRALTIIGLVVYTAAKNVVWGALDSGSPKKVGKESRQPEIRSFSDHYVLGRLPFRA